MAKRAQSLANKLTQRLGTLTKPKPQYAAMAEASINFKLILYQPIYQPLTYAISTRSRAGSTWPMKLGEAKACRRGARCRAGNGLGRRTQCIPNHGFLASRALGKAGTKSARTMKNVRRRGRCDFTELMLPIYLFQCQP